MANYYVPLPAFQVPRPIDFGPLNDGVDALSKAMEKNRLLSQAQDRLTAGTQPAPQTSSSPAQYGQPNRLLPNSSPAQYGANSVTDRIIGVESGGNPNARNPNSSAMGSGQFINSTWLSTLKATRPDIAGGRSDDELLALRSDPNLSREMTNAYASQNAGVLSKAGYQASPGNTYLAHFAGPGGATAVLKADPSTPVSAILGEQAVRANPFLANMTAGDLRNWADRKMGSGSEQPQAAPSAPAPSRPTMNYDAAMRKAAEQGDEAAYMRYAAMKQEEEQTAYTRNRQSTLDSRQGELQGLQIQGAREELETKAQTKFAAIAQQVGAMPPEQAAAVWPKLLAVNPRIATTLQQYGIDPMDYKAGTALIVAEARGLPTPKDEMTPDIKEYTFSMQQRKAAGGPVIGFEEWSKESKAAKGAEYGTSPRAWTDKDGKLHYTQLSKSGGRKDLELPEGAKWAPGIDFKDAETGFIPFERLTGQQVGPEIPKNNAGAAAQKAVGTATGQAIADLPKAEGAAQVVLGYLDDVANDPYLKSMTGPVDARLPNLSGQAARVEAKIAQLQGTAFLQAFQELKGGGAITEVEGAKAEAAKSRLAALKVNDADYPEALQQFRTEVIRLAELARTKARGAGSGAVAAPAGGPQLSDPLGIR